MLQQHHQNTAAHHITLVLFDSIEHLSKSGISSLEVTSPISLSPTFSGIAEDEKSSGKWATSFKLSGMAKGASINVSFGYAVMVSNSIAPAANRDVPHVHSLMRNNTSTVKTGTKIDQSDYKGTIRRAGSLSAMSSTSSRSIENIKDLHEVLPMSSSELSDSVSILGQKFREEKLDTRVACKPELDVSSKLMEALKSSSYLLSDAGKENAENEGEDGEFSVIEHGIELSSKEQVKLEEFTFEADDGSDVESPDLPKIDIPRC
ncbi:hypothetical protein U1Q18_009087 [Sarracenia purpurea var. burkii]